ncbi:LD-carboxypeptidase [Frateuria terrea]|uniref:Muramoyltetrapeptide carboxypeptidase n=1 Tax=Frateuria terrea TaxID=529704 RepID=A0A1H6RG76_9GAMM|nr:LD-carboxypeptidase [Frateuria terrea]SEI50605.1 muramoyltetrapeptide carboxypeptidase [Frateuria terrea]SFP15643.1 muramoyltetrapeptide carboxypeptidase [Frateuria terrea]
MPHARIRLIAPSGYAHDPAAMARGVARLREVGCTVEGLDVLGRAHLRFAGTDAERAADINALATLDELPDIALVTRGGYGAARLLGQLDYAALRERLAGSGLALVGHSDFTALQLALYAKSGVRSFAGPLLADLGAEPFPAFTWEHFWNTLAADSSEATWPHPGDGEVDVQGMLWGGNLAVLCSLLGTSYFPVIEDGILFVEDLGEPPFRIERLFYQLQLAGVLARQRALVVGDFHGCRPGPRDNGYDLDETFAQLARMAGIPVIHGLPHGHAARQLTLPFGGQARLRVNGGTARLECTDYPHR